MHQITEHILLNYKDPKYRVKSELNDSGEKVWTVEYDPKKDKDGNETNEISFVIRSGGNLGIEEGTNNLKADLDCFIKTDVQEKQVLFFNVKFILFILAVSDKKHSCLLLCSRVVQEEKLDEEAANIAKHMNATLAALSFDGKPVNAAPVTPDMVLEQPEPIAGGGAPVKSRFERAVPESGQHSQLDFLSGTKSALGALGGLFSVNATGTEFSCNSLNELSTDDQGIDGLFGRVFSADSSKTDLHDRARTLSQLFYTSLEAFDAAHDRMSEIEHGLIQRAYMYDALRSFGWTLAAYCEENGVKPAEVSIEDLEDIIAFVRKYKNLNYKPNSHLPVLCGGDDIHTYYVPDGISASDRSTLKKHAKLNDDDKMDRVLSLDGYRKDLEYLYPAMLTIARELYRDRNEDEVLEGDTAEILYAWCAVAVGSREPFFTEDGPMNNIFEHPLSDDNWELMFAKQREEQEKQHAEEWMKAHSRDLDRGAAIVFRDKKFVFDACFEGDDRLKVLEKLAAKGGLERGAVSGQTDYLVCDPRTAGDSKIRAVKEQRIKGRCTGTKIVLVEDFLKALGHTPPKRTNSYKSKIAAAQANISEAKAKLAKLLGMSAEASSDAPAKPKPASITLSWTKGLKFENDDYVIEIPDGFVIDKSNKDRDFSAFIPDESNPADIDSGTIQILPGAEVANPLELATPEGYSLIYRSFLESADAAARFFKTTDSAEYPRPDMPGAISLGIDPGHLNVQAVVMLKEGKSKQVRFVFLDVPRGEEKSYVSLATEMLDHMRPKHPVKLVEQPDSDRFMKASLNASIAKEWCSAVDKHNNEIGFVFNAVFKSAEAQYQADSNLSKLKKKLRQNVERGAADKDKLIAKCIKAFTAFAANGIDNPELPKLKKKIEELMDNATFTTNLDSEPISATCPNLSQYKQQLADAYDKPLKEAAQRKYEEQKKAYDRDLREWEQKRSDIMAKRSAMVKSRIDSRKKTIEQEAAKQMNDAVASAERDIAEQEKRIADANSTLATLGFFKGRQKKEQKAIILDAQNKLAAARSAIERARAFGTQQIEGAGAKAESERSQFEDEAAKAYPMPIKPKEPKDPSKSKPSGKTRQSSGPSPSSIKAEILAVLADGTARTVTEIIAEVPSLGPADNQRASALVRQLVEDGAVKREFFNRKAYFSLA